MLLSYFALGDRIPTLNERDHDEKDFLKIFKRKRVYYEEIPLPLSVSGYYVHDIDGQEYVTINSNLWGAEKVRSMAHETTHLLIDEPIDDELVILFRSLETLQTRQEITAEALSLILIFSLPTLEKYLITGEIPEHLLPYVNERVQIFHDYKI